MRRRSLFISAPALPALLLILALAARACAEPWSFAFFADNRAENAGFTRVLEQIKSGEPADPGFPRPLFVAGIGDIDPVPNTMRIYNEIIPKGVPFIPVRGNHESPADVAFILNRLMPSIRFPVSFYDPSSLSYYFDCRNVRFISMDLYANRGNGKINDSALVAWVEKAIESAGADHVFIALHEPWAPLAPAKDPFWSMALKHADKVRGVICGHTHSYERRVISSSDGGVLFINAGNAGNLKHSDYRLSFVEASVDGKNVLFRTIQSSGLSGDFNVSEKFSPPAVK